MGKVGLVRCGSAVSYDADPGKEWGIDFRRATDLSSV